MQSDANNVPILKNYKLIIAYKYDLRKTDFLLNPVTQAKKLWGYNSYIMYLSMLKQSLNMLLIYLAYLLAK